MSRGTTIEWIGAKLIVDAQRRTVTVALPVKKLHQLRDNIGTLTKGGKGMCSADLLRALAGLCGWVVSIIPQVRPFIRRLWAALAAPRSGDKKGLVYMTQIRTTLQWLLAFATRNYEAPIQRVAYAFERHWHAITVECDASPFGGGAVAWYGGP